MSIGLNTRLPVNQNFNTLPASGRMSNYSAAPEVLAGNSSPASPALSEVEKEQQLNTADNGVKTAAICQNVTGEKTSYAHKDNDESRHHAITTDFKQAIKDYRDKVLTGLNDEDMAKIEAELAKYLAENPGDVEGAIALKKALMKKYGFKGNEEMYIVDAMSAPAAEGSQQQTIDEV